MKAVVTRNRQLVLDTVPDPLPGPGQVLVKSLACGICGSDLHALKHMDRMVEATVKSNFGEAGPMTMDPDGDIVFGHEFCAEIVDYGPDTSRTLPVGSRVCSVPMILSPASAGAIGYSNSFYGGYGEYLLLQEDLMLPVPNGLPAAHAALTEPFAVGQHAVNQAQPGKDDVFMVIGCGPIGLAVIAALKSRGLGPVVAADFSPARRRLAETLGADVLVDPAQESPYTKWQDLGVPRTGAERMMAEMTGTSTKRPVLFECVGVPGILQSLMEGSPTGARIVVVGVCMEPDRIEPFVAINKQLELHFVLGYTPEEFAQTLHGIAEGDILAHPIVTGHVGLDGVAQAFEDLGNPEAHSKILVHPWDTAV